MNRDSHGFSDCSAVGCVGLGLDKTLFRPSWDVLNY